MSVTMETTSRINLFPYRGRVNRNKTIIFYICLLLVFIFSFYVSYLLNKYFDKKIYYSNLSLNKLVQEKNSIIKNNISYNHHVGISNKEVVQKAKYLNVLLQEKQDIPSVLKNISKLSSDAVYINKLSIKGKSVTIWINSSSSVAIYNFISKARSQLPMFKLQNVNFTSSKKTPKNKTKSVVKAKIEFVSNDC